MANYDDTSMPDEVNDDFYVDDFGEQMKRQDEALPERGEDATQPADEPSIDSFYEQVTPDFEQAPSDLLDSSYPMDPLETDDTPSYDPKVFEPDEDNADGGV